MVTDWLSDFPCGCSSTNDAKHSGRLMAEFYELGYELVAHLSNFSFKAPSDCFLFLNKNIWLVTKSSTSNKAIIEFQMPDHTKPRKILFFGFQKLKKC